MVTKNYIKSAVQGDVRPGLDGISPSLPTVH
jgi:hypothetical protein